ncbi:hypothetical protein [Sinorhizobium meliloti]|uniref:hypothetical protein n=1 Tax=Rhizobium meliloti TaxID=382 RepID=UPI0018E2704F|nr:hypothetical protein [Sinorhizobium meliloti]
MQAIADALGDTEHGLTGSEIAHLLATVKIIDTTPQMTKRHRLHNAFANEQNNRQMRTHIMAFIRKAMKPERFAREPERFEPMRLNLNRALAFAGLAVEASATACGWSLCRLHQYHLAVWPVAARGCIARLRFGSGMKLGPQRGLGGMC